MDRGGLACGGIPRTSLIPLLQNGNKLVQIRNGFPKALRISYTKLFAKVVNLFFSERDIRHEDRAFFLLFGKVNEDLWLET